MAVFLGVSKTLDFLNKKPGDTNFWCVGRESRTAKPGDQLLVYFPRTISKEKAGIGQIYQITSEPQDPVESLCSNYKMYRDKMFQIEMRLQMSLNNHIQIHELRANKELQNWKAVKCSMQGTTFAIDRAFWSSLRAQIVASNPEADAILQLPEGEANKV